MSKAWKMRVKLISVAAILIGINLYYPALLDNKNSFLLQYINYGFLPTLGIIVPITLSSITKLHVQLNRWEKEDMHEGPNEALSKLYGKLRSELNGSANWLIASLALALCIIVTKGVLPTYNATIPFDWLGFSVLLNLQTLLNSLAIMLFALNLMILKDTLGASFRLHSQN